MNTHYTKHRHSLVSRLAIILGIFVLVGFNTADRKFSEYQFVDNLNDRMDIHLLTSPEDRIYLHFDKTMYQPGDDIWFSAYVRNGQDFSASDRSEVLHVELIAPNGNAIKMGKLITKNGRVSGDFKLDEDAPGGDYKVKAYTVWQNHESKPFLFEKAIHVQDVDLPDLKMRLDFDRKGYSPGEDVQIRLELMSNHQGPLVGHIYDIAVKLGQKVVYKQQGITGATGKASIEFTLPEDARVEDGLVNAEINYRGLKESISRSLPFHSKTIDFKMYPEGGDLVEGLTSRVAFQANNDKGKPADVSGRVVNKATNEIITEFKSFHHGMGHFEITPKTNQQYRVEITKPSHLKHHFDLPLTTRKNQVLKVTSVTAKRVKIKIYSKTAEPAYVVLSVRDKLYYGDSLNLEKGINIISIP